MQDTESDTQSRGVRDLEPTSWEIRLQGRSYLGKAVKPGGDRARRSGPLIPRRDKEMLLTCEKMKNCPDEWAELESGQKKTRLRSQNIGQNSTGSKTSFIPGEGTTGGLSWQTKQKN